MTFVQDCVRLRQLVANHHLNNNVQSLMVKIVNSLYDNDIFLRRVSNAARNLRICKLSINT